jgi:hypothetical protein
MEGMDLADHAALMTSRAQDLLARSINGHFDLLARRHRASNMHHG